MANMEKNIFCSQPTTKPKGETSSSSALDTFIQVKDVITLRSEQEIDNHVGDNLNGTFDSALISSRAFPPINVDDYGESKENVPTKTLSTPPPMTTLTPLL